MRRAATSRRSPFRLLASLLFLSAAAVCRSDPNGLQDYFANFSSKYFSVDLASGTAQTSVPISVPQGRKGIAPNLALSYNSSSRGGWCGVGWSLDMGSIERSVKKGIPKYIDSQDTFQISFQGSSSDLIKGGASAADYRLKVESAFLKIEKKSKGWEVRDKMGTRYLFGSGTGVQTSALGEFKWMLDKVIDLHGNTMTITYQTDSGQAYLSRIDYVGNEITGEGPTHSVEFVMEDRPDWTMSYSSGVRVESKKRLKEIAVKVQDSLVRRYVLQYTQSEATCRSLLTGVVQYGSDGTSAMPAVQFTYDQRWHGWEQDDAWNIPDGDHVHHNSYDEGRRLADVNGDGLTDLLVGKSTDQYDWNVRAYKNTGTGWVEDPGWRMMDGNFVYRRINDGRRLADVNGDGLIDILAANRWADGNHDFHKSVCLNSGSGWVYSDARWHIPDGFFVNRGREQGRQLADVNGDGLADMLAAGDGYKAAYINNGSGWSPDSRWNIPDGEFVRDGKDQGRVLVDVNGDGLTDLLIAKDGYRTCYLNKGDGWVEDKSWAFPDGDFMSGDKQQGRTVVDINKDGLIDFLMFNNGDQKIFWNNGHGAAAAASDVTFPADASFAKNGDDGGVRIVDMNGDGAADLSIACNGFKKTYLSKAATQDLLTQIDNGIGGRITLEYTPSTKYDNSGDDGKPDLPFPVMTVSKVTSEDGLGNSYINEYTYVWGKYDYPNREFRGFGQVNVKDAEGNLTKNWFHQDDVKKGKLYMQELFDGQGAIQSRMWNVWEDVDAGDGARFPRVKEARSHLFFGGDEKREKVSVVRYQYDGWGNVTEVYNLGESGNPAGSHKIKTEYTFDTSKWIVALPARTWVEDSAGQKVSEQAFTYGPDRFNLLEKRAWLSGGSDVTTRYVYDTYGNVVAVTDPLGRMATTEYDSTFHAFAVRTTNPLGHVQRVIYDPLFGQVTSATDANNVTSITQYDVFGRPLKIIGPDASESNPSTVYFYDLSSRPVKTTVRVNQAVGAAQWMTSVTFIDGLGRKIQTLTDAETPGNYTVSSAVSFNSRGLVERETLSYEVTGAEYDALGAASHPATEYEYDAMGRVVAVTRPDGVRATSDYCLWTTTTTDGNGNQKTTEKDAFGRITAILESGIKARTDYTYNVRGDLISVRDSNGNVTAMAYDTLGRKISMDDPNMGHWTYEYDALGNLTAQTDAKGQTTRFTHDVLNRLARKSFDSGQQAVVYTFDDPSVFCSKGRLTKVQDASGMTEFYYDNEGREIRTIKTVDGNAYVVERAYDAVGRITSVKYPDGEVVRTTYNRAGGIRTINGVDQYVKDVLYTPQGQMSQIDYGNGTRTNYQYNPNTLYLEHLLTTGPHAPPLPSGPSPSAFSGPNSFSPSPLTDPIGPSLSPLVNPISSSPSPLAGEGGVGGSHTIQDLFYTFDAAGNITAIDDKVYSATQTFSYDPVNRLTGATGAYGNHTYTYDAVGNMMSKNGITYTYDAAKPHAVTATSAGFQAQYDANGNMTVRRDGTALNQSLEYDQENRLVKVTNLATKATIRLEPGWNFFSLPLVPAKSKITEVLKELTFGTDYDQISRYDAATQTWQYYVNNPTYNQFDSLEYGRGYQIYVTNPNGAVIQMGGTVPTGQSRINLLPGWNLIGAPVLREKSVDEALNGLSRLDYTSLVKYLPASDGYARYENQEFAAMVPGAGYFIYAIRSGTITAGKYSLETRFVYDGDGGRVKKISDGVETIYIGKIYEIVKAGGVQEQTTKHIFAGSTRVCSSTANSNNTASKAYYHPDHLGSASVVTDATGQVVQVVEYTPFGETSRNTRTGAVDVKHKYTGQEIDNETGLYYYNARYYDPALCRFVQADTVVSSPYDPQDLNRYAYARNNPLRYTDPTGHGFWDIFKGIFGIISAIVSFFLPPAAPAMTAINIAISTCTAIQSNNPLAAVGGLVGGMVGGAVLGAVGKEVALGMTRQMGNAAFTFAGGAIGGAIEFGAGGFGSGFGASLASGQGFGEAFKAGGIGAAIGAGSGAVIQGSYMAGWQNSLHGYSAAEVAGAQGLPSGIGSILNASGEARARLGRTGKVRLYHYGYQEDAASIFSKGLAAGQYASPDYYTSGQLAEQRLALTHKFRPAEVPNARYALDVDPRRSPFTPPSKVRSLENPKREGGGLEVRFLKNVTTDQIKSMDLLENP